jgi:hypothetical protein
MSSSRLSMKVLLSMCPPICARLGCWPLNTRWVGSGGAGAAGCH